MPNTGTHSPYLSFCAFLFFFLAQQLAFIYRTTSPLWDKGERITKH